MIIQTSTSNRFAQVQSMIKDLFNQPMSKMTERQLDILPVVLSFGDCFDTRQTGMYLLPRNLNITHRAKSFSNLCDMLCLVGGYNNYNPEIVCEVLEKHKDCLDLSTFSNSSFGRDCSPVLFLSLATYSNIFMEKINALAKDLQEVALCDELHWCGNENNICGVFTPDSKLYNWVPDYDSNMEIIGYKKEHFPELTLYTSENLCKILEWGNPESPTCCGQLVTTLSVVFQVRSAKCEVCGKTAVNVSAPFIDGSCVRMLDENLFRWEGDDALWVITTEDATITHS